MKAILDTNVVVSGLFFGGPPRRILEAWAEGRFELILSPLIFSEYERVCDRLAEKYPEITYQAALYSILGHGTLLPDPPAEEAISDDPDDDKFLRCARDANAVVVSGDDDLLSVSGWAKVTVMTPRTFWDSIDP